MEGDEVTWPVVRRRIRAAVVRSGRYGKGCKTLPLGRTRSLEKACVVQWRTGPIQLQVLRGRKQDGSGYVLADRLLYSTVGSSKLVSWW